MVVEINGAGFQVFKTYYSASLKVKITEAYGELKVSDEAGKGVPKTYVKVFTEKNGQAEFFKDGYTDIRGKFEYANSSSGKLSGVTKFAVLIMSDTHGSMIREVQPPPQDTSAAKPQQQQQQQQDSYNYATEAKPQMKQERLLQKQMMRKCK